MPNEDDLVYQNTRGYVQDHGVPKSGDLKNM